MVALRSSAASLVSRSSIAAASPFTKPDLLLENGLLAV